MSDPRTFTRFEKSDIEQSIPARFAAMVARHADRVAVKSGNVAFTYRELHAAQQAIARSILSTLDARPEPVLILMTQGASLIAAIMGVLSAGKIYVPLKSDTPPDMLARIAADSGARLALAGGGNTLAKARALDGVETLDIRALIADTSGAPAPAPDSPLTHIAPDAPAYIYYTSGTTGPAKGVVDSHRNVMHNVMRYTNNLKIGPQDRLSLVQAPSFSGAVSNVFSALLNGASVYPIDLRKTGDEELADLVNREQLTMFHSVPVIFERLANVGRALPSLHTIRLEGDRATRRHVDLYRAHFAKGCTLAIGLGTTETGLVRQFLITHDTDFAGDAVPIGYAVEDMDVFPLDEDGNRVAPGKTGEIAVRSKYLATGYWNLPDYTAAAFVRDTKGREERTYRTGDLGMIAPDGCLTYFGRKHFDVKLWGRRVNVSAIENTLRGIDGVSDSVVIVREDRPGTQQLIAYWTASEAVAAVDGTPAFTAPSVTTLRRELARRLPDIPIPSRFVKLDRIPTGPNEKVDRLALPPPGNERPSLDTEFVAPRTAPERTVAACFAEALSMAPDQVGMDDDFYDLGGDSMQAITLALLLEERLATRIPSEVFEDAFTAAHIAAHIASGERSPNLVTLREGSTDVAWSSESAVAPLFLFHNYSGLVLEYRGLAAGLDAERPILAVQYNGEPDTYVNSARLADLVAHYAGVISATQPVGPYHLAGQCFGGLVAFEVAQQFLAAGEEVALLALIDTACPTGSERLAHHFSPIRLARRLVHMRPGPAFVDLVKRLRSAARFALAFVSRALHALTGIPIPRSLARPTDVHRLAEAKYRVRPYDGALVSIVVGEPHNQANWSEIARGGVTLVKLPPVPDVPADTHLTEQPHLAPLIEALDRLL